MIYKEVMGVVYDVDSNAGLGLALPGEVQECSALRLSLCMTGRGVCVTASSVGQGLANILIVLLIYNSCVCVCVCCVLCVVCGCVGVYCVVACSSPKVGVGRDKFSSW